jgi:hypothetical protein
VNAHQKAVIEANRFHKKHPVGTPVNVERDTGEVLATETRSDPWVIGTTAVIMVKGIAGCYRLSRVTVREVTL